MMTEFANVLSALINSMLGEGEDPHKDISSRIMLRGSNNIIKIINS
jgi:hypothetical protein